MAGMALPPPNKFAVADVPALLPQTEAAPGPRAPDKVAAGPLVEGWYLCDVSFEAPRVSVVLQLDRLRRAAARRRAPRRLATR